MSNELKDCPFCGSKPVMKHIGNDHTKTRAVEVKCSNVECRIVRTDKAFSHDHAWLTNVAIKGWNRRSLAVDAVADEDRQEEAHKLAKILFGMVEGDGRVEGVNIYAEGYSAPDGDVFVLRAAELLIEQAAEAKELTRYVEHFALTNSAAPVASAAPSGEREKFEAWCQKYQGYVYKAEHEDDTSQAEMWAAWQAAIAHQPPN